ncbi:MAG: HD domain-containing protein [Bacteroidota bacterium]|nr:HD domain-containing protein [Bacteroidota bacterium]
MNDLNYLIEKAEKEWLNKLYNFCKTVFSKSKIPSHDHNHHYRVWKYCKEILTALYPKNNINYELIEGCIIASFFHDTGLSNTVDEFHGQESKKICQAYFSNQNLETPKNFSDILWAIEKHDDKNYQPKKQDATSLLSIICNADDLDAFGNIGVIRYTEIYLLRGIEMSKLPELVIQNIDNRFRYFKHTYKDYPELYQKHHTRYLITREFFKKLQEEFI